MDAWIIGLVAVCVLGVAVISYGALADRRRHRRQVAELTSAPSRGIPRFQPDAPAPAYLSELQARRPDPAASTALGVTERAELRTRLAEPTSRVQTVELGYASNDFVTDTESGWAVLDRPWVLTCAEPVSSVRELLGLLEKVIMSDHALVVVAPGMDADVLGTFEVNRIQHKLRCVVLLSKDPEPVDRIGRLTGATLVGRADLQAGYLTQTMLGRCDRWVSDAERSYLLGAPTEASPRVEQE